ncbi:MAG: DNA polymerase III subunit gamma/tau [Bacteroidetes bacterium]|nr:DNA polymerase III subunit gamma/tau [Bacteroidota bacterium]
MSQYIVSARKYRPQIFEEVVGQKQVTGTLKNALKSNHLAQSFLFCGPRGVGKTTCARILAKAINCLEPSAEMEPCNSCSSCESFNTQASFNIHELDAASNNSVDDIRSLIDQVRVPPQAGKYKVYIIDEVHMLSLQAFNAFLKTLEEPPSYAIFILATTEKHKIIPTILSRCQVYDFKRIRVRDIVEHLQYICKQEEVEAEEAALHIIGQKADGALRDALSIYDKVSSFSGKQISYKNVIDNLNILDYEYFFKITEQLMMEDSSSLLLSFDGVLSKGFEGDTFILGLAEHFRNLLMCKDPATLPLLEVSSDLADRYRQQATIIDQSFLLNGLDLMAKCDTGYKVSRNKRLHVEIALLKICFLTSTLRLDQPVVKGPSDKKKQQPLKSPEPTTTKVEESVVQPEQTLPEPAKEEVPEAIAEQVKEETPQIVEKVIPVPESVEESTESKAPEMLEKVKEPETEVKREQESIALAEETPKEPQKTEQEPAVSDNSSEDLMSQLKAAVSKGVFQSEATQKAEAIELTNEKVQEAWKKFLVEHANELPANFISNAKEMLPELKPENQIVITAYSAVAKGFIAEQGRTIKEYYREYFNRGDIGFSIHLEVDQSDDKPKQFLTPKEQFNEMAKENPSLIDFQKRFDLDIEY